MGGSTQLRHASSVTWALLLGLVLGAPATARAEAPVGVAGRVLADSNPVAEATVYAYQVVEKSLRRVLTDGGGEFAFSALPAGLYKIIAHKSGFAPAVTVLTRRSAEESQFLQVELPAVADAGADGGYWQLRAEVPGDVLREIQTPFGDEIVSLVPPSESGVGMPGFQTEVAATTAVGQVRGETPGQVVAGQLGLRGKVGKLGVAVDGNFGTIAAGSESPWEPSLAGEAAALRVRLDGPQAGRFDLAAESQRLVATAGGGEMPVDFERIFFRYHRDLGDDASTALLAQYVDEKSREPARLCGRLGRAGPGLGAQPFDRRLELRGLGVRTGLRAAIRDVQHGARRQRVARTARRIAGALPAPVGGFVLGLPARVARRRRDAAR
ncbi:MAG: Carboxypeptidase regulatory-like domain [Acidobacteria bacterium]|nr:Carboxypeptidase regulatory-like domain [Acidobacteriota bacterium]